MAVRPGSRVGPYQIVALLGAGGMGEVYKARDDRIGRDVAVKVLPAEFASDADRLRRFEQEARAAGQLNHPNILAVYDIGTHEGAPYIVTELLEGETLADRIKGSRPPVRKALEFAGQIVSGLAAAHERGIVHRDIKPANLFVTADGHVKILDFGVAKLVRPGAVDGASRATTVVEETAAGTTLGTLGYASPEQLRGLVADHRSDIFSFGCVLYEMLAGRRAFSAATPADMMTAILSQEPPPFPSGVAVPPSLERIVQRCLEKRPEERFQSGRDLGFALREETDALAGTSPTPAAPAPRRRLRIVGAASVAVLAAATVLFLSLRGHPAGRAEPAGRIRSLAVLPLANLSGDPAQEYFSDGMTERLITSLARISALKVISRTSVMQFKGTTRPIAEIAKALGVDGVIEGSVLRAGDRVRITAQLINAATDTHVWAQSYERDLRDVLALQADVARAIADEVKVAVTPQERARLAGVRPVDPEAYDAYLKGLHHWYMLTPAELDTAQRYFELALANDPNYALAHVGIALVWVGRQQMGVSTPGEAAPKAKAAALKAVALDDEVAEAHYALAVVLAWSDWDWAGAEREFKRAIELNPAFPDARGYYAHILMYLQRPAEALAQGERAVELDPFNFLFRVLYSVDLLYVRRFDDAIAQARRSLQIAPGNPVANSLLWWAYDAKGMDRGTEREAIAAVGPIYETFYAGGGIAAALERGYAQGGYRAAMTRAAEAAVAHARTTYMNPVDVAALYLCAGDRDRALEWLEKGLTARDPNMPYLGVPFYDSLRPDPRFQSLLRRMGLPTDQKD
jgi:serine/threonine-protein kinase